MLTRPKARTEQLLVQRTGQDTLIYDERTHRALSLDARAARVWELCDGTRTEWQIAEAYGEGAAGETIVRWTLGELEKSALLDGHTAAREALSRRVLVKRVGLAAIPIIMAITAPRARAAVSTCSSGGQPCDIKPCCAGLTCNSSTLICQ
jgi:hypothetical protein